jgi:hypothetical protein
VHLGSHDHPVKSGDHRDFIDLTDTLIGDQVERIPSATPSPIVLETAKEVLGPFLFAKKCEPHKILEVDELQVIFDRCKHLTSPNNVKQSPRSGLCVALESWTILPSYVVLAIGDSCSRISI